MIEKLLGDSPCQVGKTKCGSWDRCRDHELACEAFWRFVATGRIKNSLHRDPSHAMYRRAMELDDEVHPL